MNVNDVLIPSDIVCTCLEKSGILTRDTITEVQEEAERSGRSTPDILKKRGILKGDILTSLSSFFNIPFIEYNEERAIDPHLYRALDLNKAKLDLRFPFYLDRDSVHIMVHRPPVQDDHKSIQAAWAGKTIFYHIALPGDITRTIEHIQDINPGFPDTAGRTPLARVRTWLAGYRTGLAEGRTILAQGRTGLSIIRTGLAFISISLVFFRIFGLGYLSILEIPLFIIGLLMLVEGIVWYLPVRKNYRKNLNYKVTEATFGTTVLEIGCNEEQHLFKRTDHIPGSKRMRHRWNRLSPIMKRRYLAIDRTDFADERTILAHFRTLMAHTRTGLAFARTGNALAGLGIGLIRHFPSGPWTILDVFLIVLGVCISIEGLHWYLPGWRAGRASTYNVRKNSRKRNVWFTMFHPFAEKHRGPDDLPHDLDIKPSYAPGIWGTTGLGLERTLIAERRNVKARLRTIMARSRTGMAFIRTGASFFSVGMGLLVYFGNINPYWTCFNISLILLSFIFFIDGFYWHLPSEQIRNRFPYCYRDMEFNIPDYAKPNSEWETIHLDNEYI